MTLRREGLEVRAIPSTTIATVVSQERPRYDSLRLITWNMFASFKKLKTNLVSNKGSLDRSNAGWSGICCLYANGKRFFPLVLYFSTLQ